MSFKRSLVKFATVLSVFFTGISFINVPLQTQTVQAASQSKTEKRNAVVQLAKEQ
ncbi:MAG: NlpC/P60 family protein, partial [Lactobacillus crispatus]|nr:NlpC/P60 family protein [Lactobacillus crispatus]